MSHGRLRGACCKRGRAEVHGSLALPARRDTTSSELAYDPQHACPLAIAKSRQAGLLPRMPTHYVIKHLQQGTESDHFRVKQAMPWVGGFRSFNTARRMTCGFDALLCLRNGFGFAGPWVVPEQNQLLAHCFGLPAAIKA